MRKVIDLGDDLIEAIDFLNHDFVEILPKIGVVETLRQEVAQKS